mgnify:CR=1 FL=1
MSRFLILLPLLFVFIPLGIVAAQGSLTLTPGETLDVNCTSSLDVTQSSTHQAHLVCTTPVPTLTPTPVPPTQTSIIVTATPLPPTATPVPPTSTPLPPGGVTSQEFGTWHPNTQFDTCGEVEHNSYSVVGPDGKKYSTWHPPVHTNGCTFGHEHGADPRTSAADNTLPAFGYAAEQMGMAEPHVGFKVFVIIAGTPGDNGPATADHRVVFHMGTAGVGRYSQQFHSFEYDHIARDGTGRYLHLYGMGDTRPTADNASQCPGVGGIGGKIFSTVGCGEVYEIWGTVDFRITDAESKVLASMDFGPAAFQPITARDPADNSRLVYNQTLRGDGSGGGFSVNPLSPDADWRGCDREIYVGQNIWGNEGGSGTTYFTDPMGTIVAPTAPGAIRQEVSRSAAAVNPNEVFKQPENFCGDGRASGIHSPN